MYQSTTQTEKVFSITQKKQSSRLYMDYMQDPYTVYTQLLQNAFEKIYKALNSRKFKQIRELCSKAQNDSKTDRSLDANKYFPLLKLAIDTKITKVLEVSLYYIQKLISHGFMTGDCEDNCVYTSGPLVTSNRHPRKLIDAVVQSICMCVHQRDDSVQLQVIKTLLTTVTSFNCEVHDRTLLQAFRACYHIHITSKNMVNQTTAKATLTQMLHFVFQRMESTASSSNKEGLMPLVKGLLKNIVDDIQISQAKNLDVKRGVPLFLDPDDPNYKNIEVVEAFNENQEAAGKFGWCFECRKGADFYCIETRDPVCSVECKEKHLVAVHQVEIQLAKSDQNWYFHDALLIFRSICKLSLKDLSSSVSAFTQKSKVLSLELVLAVIDNPGPYFSIKPQFTDVIRDNLCNSLLSNSLSSEKTIFALSLSIFVALVNNFKDSLKAEIGVFMNEIFIKILQSENTNYHQKLLVLEVFYRITQNARTTLQLYLNYDCDVQQNDILSRMIDILAKIAVGKYRSQQTFVIQQEYTLRITALQTLANIITSQANWLESQFSFFKFQSSGDFQYTSEASTEAVTSINIEIIQKNKKLKTFLSKAALKFNTKPKQCFDFLSESNYINTQDPAQIANFLKTTPGLNKTVIGEFLAKNQPLNSQVLDAMIDMFQFQGVSLVAGIREFLQGFRIPGQAQQIDKFMEKFAAKYCKDNPEIFQTPDSAYLLAFGVMMLQTDLHNPSVKDKMPLSKFIAMFSHDQSISQNMIQSFYNQVRDNPFTLQQDEEARTKLESAGKKKHQVFDIEKKLMLKRSQQEIHRKFSKSVFYIANDIELLKKMFQALWHPLLATFSIVLQQAQDANLWKRSLHGFLGSIKIACRFKLPLQLEIFLSSLAKFTQLIYLNNQVTEKNIECMKALIEIAKIQANYLQSSWLHILKCLSKLDYLHLLSSGAQYDGPFTQTEYWSSQIVSASITPADLDYIFNMSSKLDSDAIVDFVTNLVQVSRQELWREHPQTFSLQALVNVADVNMDRMRFVWTRVWHCVKRHFSDAGVHQNQYVAIFAVDSLKQLAMKFLKKEELSDFNFQKEFLQPFESIIKQSGNLQVKELVVACMGNFVFTLAENIKSGWRSVFQVLVIAGRLDEPPLIQPAYAAIEDIVKTHLSKVYVNFTELLNCLGVLAGCGVDQVCLKSIDLLYLCAKAIASQQVSKDLWVMVYSGIAARLVDSRYELQTKSLQILFQLFGEYGDLYEQEQWKMIYSGVILPIFDDVIYGGQIDRDWLNNTCMEALGSLVRLINQRYESLNFLVPDYLLLLKKMISTGQESIAKVSIQTLSSLGKCGVNKFTSGLWESFFSVINEAFSNSLPTELKLPFDGEKLSFQVGQTVEKCVIQLHLITASKEVIKANPELPIETIEQFLPIIKNSYTFAKEFNVNIEFRKSLWKGGFLSNMKSLPGIFKQEKEGLACFLLYWFNLNQRTENRSEGLYVFCGEVIQQIQRIAEVQLQRKEEIENLIQVVTSVLIPAATLDIENAVKAIGQDLMGLVTIEDSELREKLKDLLLALLPLIR